MSIQSDIMIIEKKEIKEPSKYKVIIHDNPITSFEEVIFIVSRCFDKTEKEAEELAHTVNNTGKGVCGIYSKETAESKLLLVDMAKKYLITNFRHRAAAVAELTFTLEQE